MNSMASMTPRQIDEQFTQDLFRQLGHELVMLRAELMRSSLQNQVLQAQVTELQQELAVFRAAAGVNNTDSFPDEGHAPQNSDVKVTEIVFPEAKRTKSPPPPSKNH